MRFGPMMKGPQARRLAETIRHKAALLPDIRQCPPHFHPGQQAIWEAVAGGEHDTVVVCCGAQAGKTVTIPEIALLVAVQAAQNARPGDEPTVLITSVTNPLFAAKLRGLLIEQFRDSWGIASVTLAPRLEIRIRAEVIERLGGPRRGVLIRSGLLSEPGSLESATIHAVISDEPGQTGCKAESFRAIERRRSTTGGLWLMMTTPYGFGGTFKSDYYDRAARGDKGFTLINFASDLNPSFPVDGIAKAEQIYPAWYVDQMYRGKYTRPAGLVYDCISDEHVVPAFPVPGHWRRHAGFDFGPNNTAAVCIAEAAEKGRAVAKGTVLAEWDQGDLFVIADSGPAPWSSPAVWKRNLDTMMSRALRQNDRLGSPGLIVGGNPDEVGYRSALLGEGVPCGSPAFRDVERGILSVYSLLKGRRLRVFKTAEGVREELFAYSRKVDEQFNVSDELERKSIYHRVDALRAICTHLAPDPSAGLAYDYRA